VRRRSRNQSPVEEATCVDLTLSDVRQAPLFASGYSTDAAYRLVRSVLGTGIHWELRRETIPPVQKSYDSGNPSEWLNPYFEEMPATRVRFIGFRSHRDIVALVTYSEMRWNDTIWLMDIRVREGMRRSGHGSALMDALKGRAHSLRTRGIFVETQIANVPAIDFYQKHGFRVSGFNDHLYENDDLDRQDVALYLFWERD
jgi:GNAT superfamily N-acetyltransferase